MRCEMMSPVRAVLPACRVRVGLLGLAFTLGTRSKWGRTKFAKILAGSGFAGSLALASLAYSRPLKLFRF